MGGAVGRARLRSYWCTGADPAGAGGAGVVHSTRDAWSLAREAAREMIPPPMTTASQHSVIAAPRRAHAGSLPDLVRTAERAAREAIRAVSGVALMTEKGNDGYREGPPRPRRLALDFAMTLDGGCAERVVPGRS